MSKVLVSYFSASGITKSVAEQIATFVEGDLFEIEPVEKYTEQDLDWRDQNSRSTIEMNDRSFRPPVLKKLEDVSLYDTVMLGFPVWWDVAPTIINTFLEENDLTGKKIYVFVTSGGSRVDGSLNDLRKTYPQLNIVDGKRIQQVSADVVDWIKG